MLRKDIGLQLLSSIALTGALLLGGCKEETLLDDVKSRGELVIGVNAGWVPQAYQLEDGTWAGYDAEVGIEIADRLGVTAQIVATEWEAAVGGNWRGRWDIIVASMAKTEERDLAVEFVEPPYRYDTAYFFTRADGTGVDYEDIDENTEFCVLADTSYDSWFTGSLSLLSGQIITDPPEEISLTTVSGSCEEGTIGEGYDYDLYVDSYASSSLSVQAGEVVATGPKLFVEDLFVVVDRSSSLDTDSLRDAVSAILQEMHDDGTLTSISMETYGDGVDLSVTTP